MADIENKMVVRGDTRDAIQEFDKLQRTLYVNGKSLESYGSKLSGFFTPALAISASVVAASAAVGMKIRSYASDVAASLEEATAKIQHGTGAVGDTLKQYREYTRELYRENPIDSYSEAGQALSAVQSATDATGEHLKKLTQQFLSLQQVSGAELNPTIRICARLFKDWNVEADKQTDTLDALYVAARSTGTAVDKLAESTVQFGPKFRILGYSLQETIGLMAKWQHEGVNIEKMLTGLAPAIVNLSKKAKDVPSAWKAVQSSIRNAKTEVEAINIAVKYFGTKAATDMAAAIRENRFELGAMSQELNNASGEIQKTNDGSKTLTERFKELRNTAKDKLLQPLGEEVREYLSHVADLLSVLVDWADKNDIIKESVDALFEGLGITTPTIENFKKTLNSIDVKRLKDEFRTFGEMLGLIYSALKKIAEQVPWKFLIEHADQITQIVVYGWAASKVMTGISFLYKLGSGAEFASTKFKTLHDWIVKFEAAKNVAGMFTAASLPTLGHAKYGASPVLGEPNMTTGGVTAGEILSSIPGLRGDKVSEQVGKLPSVGKEVVEQAEKMPGALDKAKTAFSELLPMVGNFTKELFSVPSALKVFSVGIGGVADLLINVDKEAIIKDEEVAGSLKVIDKAVHGDIDAYQSLVPAVQKYVDQLIVMNKRHEYEADGLKKSAGATKTYEYALASLYKLAQQGPYQQQKVPYEDMIDATISAIGEKIDYFQKSLAEAREKEKQAVTSLGISQGEADSVVKEAMSKTAKDIISELNQIDPFMATSFIDRMSELGRKSGDSLITALSDSLKKGAEAPISDLAKAISNGALSSAQVKEAMSAISKSASDERASMEAAYKEKYGGTMSDSLIRNIADSQWKDKMKEYGLDVKAPKVLNGMSGGVTQDNRKQNVMVNVSVGKLDTKNADKIGQQLGNNLVKSFDMGY